MSREEIDIIHKKFNETLIAGIRSPTQKRDELKGRFEKLLQECGNLVCGPPMAIYYYDTPVEGFDVEVAYPVKKPIRKGDIESKVLKGCEALTLVHNGPYEQLGESSRKLYSCMYKRGLPAGLRFHEVYLTGPFCENPEENSTELQATIHDWDNRFRNGLERVLGKADRERIMVGYEELNLASSVEDRSKWVCAAMDRLDTLATEDQKFEILSRCAHVRPMENISRFKIIYDETSDLDKVLAAIAESANWIEKPYREGNIIYISKVAANREAWEKAKTPEEKKRHYCFCPLVKYMPGNISKTFCYCGAGWNRQLFEEVLGKQVKVDVVASVAAGDDICRFAVHLPNEL